MLALFAVSVMLQVVACTLGRNWTGVFEGLGCAAAILGLLAWAAGRRR